MKLHTLLLTGAAVIALAACQPKSETDGAVPAAAPPPAEIAAPTPQSGPAAPNSTDTLASAPPAATPPAATPAPAAPPAATPPAGAAPKVSAAAAATTPEELANGRAVFARSCVMCHGPTGGGASIGPEIKIRDLAAIRDKVTRGAIKPDDKMPAMTTMGLSASDISDVSKFVAAGLPQ